MKYSRLIMFFIGIILLYSLPSSVLAEHKNVVVVVHKKNPTEKMTHSQVIDLFMGKYVAFPDGRKALPLDLSGNDEVKKQFYKSLVGMSLARVNSYWSRIKFTGRVKPSIKQLTENDVINYISDSTDAIGYVSRSNLNKELKVVYEFHE